MGKFSKLVRRLDFFGEPPRFLYKGEDTYKTKLGGIVSLFFVISPMLVYSAYKINSLVSR